LIRPLRARHRAIFVMLALLLPPALAIALASRRAPATGVLPQALVHGLDDARVAWSDAVELATSGLRARQARGSDGRLRVELGGEGPRRADVLVYLAPRAPAEGELPEGARLVGPLGSTSSVPRMIELPSDASGWLVLFSLADGVALGALELEE
jgi:hypothetical protein